MSGGVGGVTGNSCHLDPILFCCGADSRGLLSTSSGKVGAIAAGPTFSVAVGTTPRCGPLPAPSAARGKPEREMRKNFFE